MVRKMIKQRKLAQSLGTSSSAVLNTEKKFLNRLFEKVMKETDPVTALELITEEFDLEPSYVVGKLDSDNLDRLRRSAS